MRATIEGVILRHTYRSSLCATASLCMVPLVVNSSISLTSLYYPDQYTRKKHKTPPKLISGVLEW